MVSTVPPSSILPSPLTTSPPVKYRCRYTYLPIRTRARNNRKNATKHQRRIKRNLPPHDVRGEAPKQRAEQHSHVRGNGHAVRVARAELDRGLAGDDGLDEQDEAVDGVAEAVEHEEFPVVRGEADFVCGGNELVSEGGGRCGVGILDLELGRTNGVVDEMHLCKPR